MTYVLYISLALGAIALYLMMPRGRNAFPMAGALLGTSALIGAGIVLFLAVLPEDRPSAYYYIFSVISLAAAGRVITHTRPVYSALYFVLVVLATTGLLVLLEAEFMAFAMVLIYGGAILVTYLFVIMLATLPQSDPESQTGAICDRMAREPFLAVVMGVVLVAASGSAFIQARPPDVPASSAILAEILDEARLLSGRIAPEKPWARERALNQMTDLLRRQGSIQGQESVSAVDLSAGRAQVRIGPGTRPRWVQLEPEVLNQLVTNLDRVGLNMFRSHTLGIELAGVILLLSMVGAIVIARQQIPAEPVAPGQESRP